MTELRTLEISTAHITEEDARSLQGAREVWGHPMQYGWVVPVWSGVEESLSPSFQKVVQHARDHGFDLVVLDREAQVSEGLEVFNWFFETLDNLNP